MATKTKKTKKTKTRTMRIRKVGLRSVFDDDQDNNTETLIRSFYDTLIDTDGRTAFAGDPARIILFQKDAAPQNETNWLAGMRTYTAFAPFGLRVHGVFHSIPSYDLRDALAAEIEHGLRITYCVGDRVCVDHEEMTRDEGCVPGNVLRFSKHIDVHPPGTPPIGQSWRVEVHVSDRLRNALDSVDGYKLIRVYVDGRLTRSLV